MAYRVFLVGFMGCGKSSFGRALAKELRWTWMDSDHEIESRAGCSIAEIFAKRGEAAFRAMESKVIDEVTGSAENIVVSLGGGTPCQPGVMEKLVTAGEVIYIKMPTMRLVQRLSTAGRAKRPKIAGMNDVELACFIEKTLPEREKFYNRANFVLDCGDAAEEILLRVLVGHVENFGTHLEKRWAELIDR